MVDFGEVLPRVMESCVSSAEDSLPDPHHPGYSPVQNAPLGAERSEDAVIDEPIFCVARDTKLFSLHVCLT